MHINGEKFQDYMSEIWEEHMIDMTDNITSYVNRFCPVPENVLYAILAASKESYLAALKTVETAIAVSLED